ncbi:MAG: YkgJ family cysteine cluster protein [Desulfobacterales bacterium]
MGNHRYFFHDGIHFTCIRCGTCCTGEPGIVSLSEPEAHAIASYLRSPLSRLVPDPLVPAPQGFSIREHADGRCYFYDQGCRIYPARPRQCRSYPFWVANLRSHYRWKQSARHCPGIGQGRLHTYADILARLQDELSEKESL